jgi:hypothetical protein
MDTVCETYGEYIKLTWAVISDNQDGGCSYFEVFAHINRTKIISAHYSDGEKLEDPRLEGKEGDWELHFTKYYPLSEGSRETSECVEIETIEQSAFGANKENKTSFKF